MFLSEEQEKDFIFYMKEEVGVVNHVTLHDAVCFARLWVMEGGYTDPSDLWVCFNKYSVIAELTNHFEISERPLQASYSKWIGVESSTQA